MRLSEVDIPDEAKKVFTDYRELYPPQEEAIRKGVLNGKSIILASPTASGKTMIAEFCALKNILERHGRVLYLVPLRALASEKFETFQRYSKLSKPDGKKIKVAVTSGDYDSRDPYLEQYDLIIATNEKADSLIRHKTRWMSELNLIVADEVHLLQDPDRGPTLEVAITKLKQINPRAQFLALSATVKNVEDVAAWIEAEYVAMDWRPVPLKEGVFFAGQIVFQDGSIRSIPESHTNVAVRLAVETVREGGQALIFAETRRLAVSIAQKAAFPTNKLLTKSEKRALATVSEKILSLGEKTTLSETLARLAEDGVCAHHAGIHSKHRRVIEENFRNGLIKILAATPTLAAGVNLPARSVIINNHIRYEPGYGRMEIPVLEYKQMAGRAGRPKYDNAGEAVLVASTQDEQDYLMEYYVCSQPEKVWSKLSVERTLRSHVLASIASDFTRSEAGLFEFFGKTLYSYQYGSKIIERPILKALQYLVEQEMVRHDGNRLSATLLGRRVSELYIDPDTAIIIRDGMKRKPSLLTDISFLQLIAHTPDLTPKLYPARREIQNLELFLEEHSEELIFPAPSPWEEYIDYEIFLGELKSVQTLHCWIEEICESEILKNIGVEPGDLYRLVEMTDWLLHAAYELAKIFKIKEFIPQMEKLQARIENGVKTELLPLVTIEGVGRIRARNLYNAGYKSLEILKRASITELINVPTIGDKMARHIKETVGGKISREELDRKALKKTGVQEPLEFFVK